MPGQFGDSCQLACDDEVTCNGNGFCGPEAGQCVCNSDFTGEV